MSNIRIKDIETTASSSASDDYVALDGATNGTRKIKASDLAADTNTTYSISISNGVITLTGSDSSSSTVTLPIYSGGVS